MSVHNNNDTIDEVGEQGEELKAHVEAETIEGEQLAWIDDATVSVNDGQLVIELGDVTVSLYKIVDNYSSPQYKDTLEVLADVNDEALSSAGESFDDPAEDEWAYENLTEEEQDMCDEWHAEATRRVDW